MRAELTDPDTDHKLHTPTPFIHRLPGELNRELNRNEPPKNVERAIDKCISLSLPADLPLEISDVKKYYPQSG